MPETNKESEVREYWDDFFKEWQSGTSKQERLDLYTYIMERAINPYARFGPFAGSQDGIEPLQAQDIAFLAWGMSQDSEIDWLRDTPMSSSEFQVIMAQNAKINPQNPTFGWWTQVSDAVIVQTKVDIATDELEADSGRFDTFGQPMTNQQAAQRDHNMGSILDFLAVVGIGGIASKIFTTRAGVAEISMEALGPILSQTGKKAAAGGAGRAMGNMLFGNWKRQLATTTGAVMVGGGILGNVDIYGQAGEPGQQFPSGPSPAGDPSTDVGDFADDSLILIDPRSGQVIEIPQSDLAGTPAGENAGVTTPPMTADMSPGLINLATQLGIDPSVFQFDTVDENFNRGVLGEVNVLPSKFAGGLTLGGDTIGAPGVFSGGLGGAQGPIDPSTPEGGGAFVPPGAAIIPGAFTIHQGKTLLQWAAEASQTFGVPLDVLYGVISIESGWNFEAINNDGSRVGLGQISVVDSGISRENALNPVFSIRYVAQKLKEQHNQYFNWEAAIVGYRDPEAAVSLMQDGMFNTAFQKAYLTSVASTAMNSGLGDVLFGDQESFLNTAKTRGSGSGGPKFAPFVAPDPATLRQFTKSAFSEIIGRDEPTESELQGAVNNLTDLFRQEYNASISRAQGNSVPQVNPQDRFLEALEQSGEGQFRKERTKTRSMMEFMGNIAALLESGI